MPEDLGHPSSYVTLTPGRPVYSCDGVQLGKVERVLADVEEDIFDGLILHTAVLSGGHRFIAGEQVEEIFEGGVLLKLDRAAADSLPEPTEKQKR